jgi:hypothetical protein
VFVDVFVTVSVAVEVEVLVGVLVGVFVDVFVEVKVGVTVGAQPVTNSTICNPAFAGPAMLYVVVTNPGAGAAFSSPS